MNDLAERCNYMPNSSEIHLPYTTKTMVYHLFVQYLQQQNIQPISMKYFIQVWKTKLNHIKVRKVTKFSKCNI